MAILRDGMVFIISFHFSQEEAAMYGIDWDGPIAENTNENNLEVPNIPCPLLDTDLDDLKENINPLRESSFQGVDIYLETVALRLLVLYLDPFGWVARKWWTGQVHCFSKTALNILRVAM